jgi:hypothetical protein
MGQTGTKSYDLYLTDGQRRLRWSVGDHGVTLNETSIAWSCDGQDHDAPYSTIVEVHLQSGTIGEDVVATCRISFIDGTVVATSSGRKGAAGDDEQAAIYRDFVQDLHGRLASLASSSIAFTAGYGEGRYKFGIGVMVVAGMFFLALPLVLTLITGDTKAFYTLYAGALLVWPIYKVVTANKPRSYDPRELPDDLTGRRATRKPGCPGFKADAFIATRRLPRDPRVA